MEEHLAAFKNYVQNYDPADLRIQLKIRHTMRVVANMEALLQAENIQDPHFCEMARLAALYHDIGRFEQLRRWNTFFDHESTDHAALSVEILKQENLLADLDPADQQTLLEVIETHNKLRINPALTGSSRNMAGLLRDADKLDILRVAATEQSQAFLPGQKMNLARQVISDGVYESLIHHQPVNKQDRTSTLDILLTYVGFFYDFYTTSAIWMAKEQGYYLKPFEHLQLEDEAAACRLEEIFSHLHKWIDTLPSEM